MYEKILSKMPKVNSEVVGPNGKGVVVYNDILRERVSVKRQTESDSIVIEDFDLDEIEGYGDKTKKEAKAKEKQAEQTKQTPVKEEKGESKAKSEGVTNSEPKKESFNKNRHKKNFHKNNKNRT